jgi:hypothetical protein
MKIARRPLLLLVLSGIGLSLGAIWFIAQPQPSLPTSNNVQPKDYRPPGPPDRPNIVITADHQLARVQDKDVTGRSPLEYVETLAGRVTVKRTFAHNGELLKEEAFLAGKRVPIPK